MYEGDTMTQIFKRTKKCCGKLIRKLTFNAPTPVNFPIKLRSTNNTARYIQQNGIICAGGGCDEDISKMRNSPGNSLSPSISPAHIRIETGWDLARNERISSIPPATTRTMKSCSMDNNNGCPHDEVLSCDDEDYQMFHISPRFFLKRDTTMYSRVDSGVGDDGSGGGVGEGCGAGSRRNCNFGQRLGVSNLMASMILSRRDLGRWNKSHQHNNSCCSDDEIVTNMKDCGIEDMRGMSTAARSTYGNYNNGSAGRQKIDRTQPQFIGGNITDMEVMWNGNKNETTTSFIVPQPLMAESRDTARNSKDWRATTPSDPIEIADRMNCERFCNVDEDSLLCTQIVFEKVKYDKSKRYLRHTPTNSSVCSVASSPHSLCNGTLFMLDHSQSSFSLDDEDNSFSDNNLYSTTTSASHSPCSKAGGGGGNNRKCCNSCSYDANGNCYSMNGEGDDGHLGSDSNTVDEKAINRINSLQREYMETWDSNGNSADSRRILCEEAWNVFENKINTARDKKRMILYAEDCEDYIRSRSSPRSSSTTLETWVDDEILDNSFNEELERQNCVSFER